MPQNNNPFEEFGGQEITTEQQDPFAEFGGKSIGVKKKNGQSQNGSTVSSQPSNQLTPPLSSPTEQINDLSPSGLIKQFGGGSEPVGKPPFAVPSMTSEQLKAAVENNVKKIHNDAGYEWQRPADVIGHVDTKPNQGISMDDIHYFLEGIRKSNDFDPRIDPLTKTAVNSYLNSAEGVAQGVHEITNAKVGSEVKNIWQAFEMPAALAKTAFSGAGLVVPELQAFNTAMAAGEKVLPSDLIGYAMSPIATFRANGGVVAVPINGVTKVFNFGQTGDEKQAAGEIGDLVYNLLLFGGAKELATKVIHNVPLEPMEQQEVNRLVDEGLKDAKPLDPEALKKVPQDLPDEKKAQVVPLISEKQAAEKQIQTLQSEKTNLDPAFHEAKDKEIAAEEKKISDSDTEIKKIIAEPTKEVAKPNADYADTLREILDDSIVDKDSNPLTFAEQDKIHGAINAFEEGKISGKDVYQTMVDNGMSEKYLHDQAIQKLQVDFPKAAIEAPKPNVVETKTPLVEQVAESSVEGGKLRESVDMVGHPFPDSQVKEVAYHGSPTEIKDFDELKKGSRYGGDKGFYFTTYEPYAKKYTEGAMGKKIAGASVTEVYLDVKNPLRVSTKGSLDVEINKNYERAKKEGYDSIIATDETSPKVNEIVVFDKKQIKVKPKSKLVEETPKNVEQVADKGVGESNLPENADMAKFKRVPNSIDELKNKIEPEMFDEWQKAAKSSKDAVEFIKKINKGEFSSYDNPVADLYHYLFDALAREGEVVDDSTMESLERRLDERLNDKYTQKELDDMSLRQKALEVNGKAWTDLYAESLKIGFNGFQKHIYELLKGEKDISQKAPIEKGISQKTQKTDTSKPAEQVAESSVEGGKLREKQPMTQFDYFKEKNAEEKKQLDEEKSILQPQTLSVGDVTSINNGRGGRDRLVIRDVIKNDDGTYKVVYNTTERPNAVYERTYTESKFEAARKKGNMSMSDAKKYEGDRTQLPEIPKEKRIGFIKEPFKKEENVLPPVQQSPETLPTESQIRPSEPTSEQPKTETKKAEEVPPQNITDVKGEDVQKKLQQVEKEPIKINVTQDASGKMEQGSDEIITQIKSELDKIGLPYKDVTSNEKGSTYYIETNDGTKIEAVKILATGGKTGKMVQPFLQKAKWINHLIRNERDAVIDWYKKSETKNPPEVQTSEPVIAETPVTANKTFTEKGKVLAEKIRKLKSKPLELKDENGNPLIISEKGFDFNPIIDAIADGVEKGGELLDVIKSELEKAKWYQNLTDKGKQAVSEQLRNHFENPPDFAERKFGKQILKSEEVSPEVKAEVQKNLEYVRRANSLTVNEATDLISKVGDEEAFNLVTQDRDIHSATRVVMGQVLIKKFSDLAGKATDESAKNYYLDKGIDTANFVTEKLGTEAGQSIQAFSLFSRLSPEGQLRAAQKEKAGIAKNKINKRKKDIDKIGDRFKDANTEAVNEVLDSKPLKDAVEKTNITRTTKAKDKIAKARIKRKQIIEDYKNRKPNLYSSAIPGLTNEGIEFVGKLAKTYIDEGIAQSEILIEKIKDHLKEVSGKPINDEVEKNIRDIAEKQIGKADTKLIGGALKDLNVKVADVVRRHFTVAERVKTDLAKKLVDDAGLEGTEATELAQKVQEAFDRVATRKKQQILAGERKRFDRVQEKLKSGKKVEPKALQDEIIKFSNLGAFDNAELADVIAKKLGTDRLTPEQANEIIRLSNRIQTAPEGSPKREATEDLLAYRAKIAGTSVGEVAQGVWYANVLSGWVTHAKNIISTFFNATAFAGAEALRDPRSIPYLLSGAVKGTLRRGLPEALNTLTTGRSPIHVSKVEVPNILERTKFKGGLLNPANYLKFVTRAMVAEDVLGFQGLKEMRATQLALSQAKKEGLNPLSKQAWHRVNEILLNTKDRYDAATEQVKQEGLTGQPAKRRTWELMEQNRPQGMVDDSYGFAAKGTFNHNTEGSLGALTDAFAKTLDIEVKGTRPLRFVVPFTRIVTNVVNNALDFSPIGLVRASRGVRGFEAMKDKYHTLSKEERTQLIARSSLGISLTAGMVALAQTGQLQITGGGTGNYKKDEQLRQSGWQPYSIKIGDKYFSYQYTPLVFNLALAGNYYDHMNYDNHASEETALKKLELSSWQAAKLMSDMTWVGSTSTLMSALGEKDPDQLSSQVEKSLGNSAKSFVLPNAYSQAAKTFEDINGMSQKQTNGLFDRMIQDVPIARNTLNNKLNALGDEIPVDASIFTSSTIPNKYWDYLNQKGAWVSSPNKGTVIVFDDATKQDRPITDDEYYNLIQLRGKKIKEKLDNLFDNGAQVKISKTETEHKSADEMTKAQLQNWLESVSRQATIDAKEELFNPETTNKPNGRTVIQSRQGASSGRQTVQPTR